MDTPPPPRRTATKKTKIVVPTDGKYGAFFADLEEQQTKLRGLKVETGRSKEAPPPILLFDVPAPAPSTNFRDPLPKRDVAPLLNLPPTHRSRNNNNNNNKCAAPTTKKNNESSSDVVAKYSSSVEPTADDLAAVAYMERFATDDEARLKTVMDETRAEAEGLAFDAKVADDALAACPRDDDPLAVVKHLSRVVRRDARLTRAPVAWFRIHRRLGDAFVAIQQKPTEGCDDDDASGANVIKAARSAVFHLQQAVRGLDLASGLATTTSDSSSSSNISELVDVEKPRAEIDIARCFGNIADALSNAHKGRRADRRRQREAVQRELESAEIAIVHAKESAGSELHLRSAHEERGNALLRWMVLVPNNATQANAILDDAITSLAEATKDDDDDDDVKERSRVSPELLGRLAECYLARAAATTASAQRLAALKLAHQTTRRLQARVAENTLVFAASQIACAHVQASQLSIALGEDAATAPKFAAGILNNVEAALKDLRARPEHAEQRVALYCLEARTWMLENSLDSALQSLELASKDMAVITAANGAMISMRDDVRRAALRREIWRAIACVALKKADDETLSLSAVEKKQLESRAIDALVSVSRELYGTRDTSRRNPDASCISTLELARAHFRADQLDEAHTATNRALFLAFDVLRRIPHEPSAPRARFDAARTVLAEIVDVGVDVVARRLKRDYVETLKTSGAWLWLPCAESLPSMASEISNEEVACGVGQPKNRFALKSSSTKTGNAMTTNSLEVRRAPLPVEALDLLRYMEALFALDEVVALHPVIEKRLEEGSLPTPIREAAVSAQTKCLELENAARKCPNLTRSLALAPEPLPSMLHLTKSSISQATFVDLLKPVPIVLRASTTRIKSDTDHTEATAATVAFADLLEAQSNDFALACLGSAFRAWTNNDFLRRVFSFKEESTIVWAVCGKSPQRNLVGIALCSSPSDGAPRGGIFFTTWTDKRARDIENLAAKVRCERDNAAEAAAIELSRFLKIDALLKGLPTQMQHLLVVLPRALANIPIHALPLEGARGHVCDRFAVRYASSLAAAATCDRRGKFRHGQPQSSLPLLAVTRHSGPKQYQFDGLLEGALSAMWDGPQTTIVADEHFVAALLSSPDKAKTNRNDDTEARVLEDLKYAHSVQLSGVTHGLESAGGIPALHVDAVGPMHAIKLAATQPLFERARMLVVSNGVMPRPEEVTTVTIPTALLCVGAGAVVASLWDPPPGDRLAHLVRAVLTLVVWQRHTTTHKPGNRPVATAVRLGLCWLRTATVGDARAFVDSLSLDDARRRKFRSAFHDIFGPEAGNSSDEARLAPDIVDWAAFACFGDGIRVSYPEEFSVDPCRRASKRNAGRRLSKAKATPSELLARAIPSVAHKVTPPKAKKQPINPDLLGEVKVNEDGEVEGDGDVTQSNVYDDDDDNDSMEDDTLAAEIAAEWVAYTETREGRELVEELGPEQALPGVK